MDITTLKQIVKDSLKNGQFSLDTSLLNSPSITTIATDNFPNKILNLTPDSKTPIIEPPDGQSIIVVGTGIMLPFSNLHVQAKFYILNQNAALTLCAVADPGYTLDKSFPLFKNNLGSAILFATTPALPSIYLLSDPDQGRNSGLSFEGNIDLTTMSGGLSSLLGIGNQSIKGPVILKNGASLFQSIEFDGPAINNVNLWVAKNCTVEFKIANYLFENPYSNSNAAVPYIEMDLVIPFTAQQKPYKIPLSVSITNFDSDIRFQANLSDVIDAGLEEISSLANNVGLSSILPSSSSFPIEKVLKFSDFYMDYNAKSNGLSCIGLQVQSTAPWTILTYGSGKTLKAEIVQLDFAVMTPFSSPSPFITVSGDIALTKTATLSIMGQYPNWEIQGYLKDGSVLSLKEVIEEFLGDAKDIPDLSVTEFGFDVQSENYSFDVGLYGSWTINGDSSLALTVENLRFALSSSKQEKTAQISGAFSIASVGLFVNADYDSSPEKSGWQFSGGTEPGQIIPIGNFIDYLTQTFKIGSPPQWIKNIMLQDLTTDFNTASKDFDFSVTGNIPLGASTDLQITVGFAMTSSGTTYKKTLSGSFKIGSEKFTLIFSEGSDEQYDPTFLEPKHTERTLHLH